jgi:hypothetical protein
LVKKAQKTSKNLKKPKKPIKMADFSTPALCFFILNGEKLPNSAIEKALNSLDTDYSKFDVKSAKRAFKKPEFREKCVEKAIFAARESKFCDFFSYFPTFFYWKLRVFVFFFACLEKKKKKKPKQKKKTERAEN